MAVPALSSIHGELSERDEDFVEGVEELEQDKTSTSGREPNLPSVGIPEEIDEEQYNHIEKSILESTDDETWSESHEPQYASSSEEEETIEVNSDFDDSDDEEYIPPYRISLELTEASSAENKSESVSPSATVRPQQDQNEKPQDSTPSGSLAECPSCGFALLQWFRQNGITPNPEQQAESIEVILEVEQREDPVSGAEEADGESDVSEEEEVESEGSGVDEGNGENSDKDWTPPWRHIQTNPTETAAAGEVNTETADRPGKRKLCTECGEFYHRKLHECEYKTKPFVCNICGRRFISEAALKIHGRIHSESYEHSCKYCFASFKMRVDKLAHELIHREQKDPFKCPDCALTFTSLKKRAEHMKQHGKQFPCAVCGIVFKEKSRFLRHVVVHTGEKVFKCLVCDRGFSQPSHLKSHMRLHTGERPYSCRHCDKSFNHNVSLKSHVQCYHAMEEEELSTETQETGTEVQKASYRATFTEAEEKHSGEKEIFKNIR